MSFFLSFFSVDDLLPDVILYRFLFRRVANFSLSSGFPPSFVFEGLRVLHTLRPVRRVVTRHRAQRIRHPLQHIHQTVVAAVGLLRRARLLRRTPLTLAVEATCRRILLTLVVLRHPPLRKRAAV